MERWLQIVVISLFLTSCDNDPCLKSAGEPVQFEIEPQSFHNLEINDSFEIELIHSNDIKIEVSTKEHLKDFLEFKVVDSTLVIKDNNKCTWLREYHHTSIKIYHPDLKKITHYGNNKIYSIDTLFYKNLTLFAKETTGDFDLIIVCAKVVISINSINNIKLTGRAIEFYPGVYSGDGRINASGFTADYIQVFHRGTNDIMLFPVKSINGSITGLGDIIIYHKPPEINIEDKAPGQLIIVN